MGMVETLRGQGTFITTSAQMLQEIKTEMAATVLTHFVAEMRSLGFADQELLALLKTQLAKTEEVNGNDPI